MRNIEIKNEIDEIKNEKKKLNENAKDIKQINMHMICNNLEE